MNDTTPNPPPPATPNPIRRRSKRVRQEPSAFNLRLRVERVRAKLSQQALAKLTGINAITINCLETGRAQAPSWETYKKVVAVLPGVAGVVDETRLLGWLPEGNMKGSGVRHTPQVRLLKEVAALASKGVLADVQELLDAAHGDGITVAELLSVVTT